MMPGKIMNRRSESGMDYSAAEADAPHQRREDCLAARTPTFEHAVFCQTS
jgi:hypothetical protein